MNKLLKLSAAGALLSSSALYGQIEITDNLSITGFLDMSAFHTTEDDSTSFDLDQMEIDFLFGYDQVSGQVDIDYERGQDGVDLEQAFITYDLGQGTSLTAGKFLSYHGWETAEPTGLYQYSYAYGTTIPGYHNGISLDHSADWGALGIAVLDSVYDDDGFLSNDEDDYEMGLETKLVLTPMEGLTLYLGYGIDSGNRGIEDRELINFWTSYEWGMHTVAVEFNDYSDSVQDINQWLVMYSAAVTDQGTVTLRVSDDKRDYIFPGAAGSGQREDEDFKYTAAYIHSFTDNLALVSEVSYTDMGSWRGSKTELAVEALFTF